MKIFKSIGLVVALVGIGFSATTSLAVSNNNSSSRIADGGDVRLAAPAQTILRAGETATISLNEMNPKLPYNMMCTINAAASTTLPTLLQVTRMGAVGGIGLSLVNNQAFDISTPAVLKAGNNKLELRNVWIKSPQASLKLRVLQSKSASQQLLSQVAVRNCKAVPAVSSVH